MRIARAAQVSTCLGANGRSLFLTSSCPSLATGRRGGSRCGGPAASEVQKAATRSVIKLARAKGPAGRPRYGDIPRARAAPSARSKPRPRGPFRPKPSSGLCGATGASLIALRAPPLSSAGARPSREARRRARTGGSKVVFRARSPTRSLSCRAGVSGIARRHPSEGPGPRGRAQGLVAAGGTTTTS